MRRSAVASDVLDQLKACFGEQCGEYVFSRSRGVPPADCNSITASWIDRTASNPFDECSPLEGCGEWLASHGLRITITRICMGPDGKPTFDWRLEDAAAACFEDDVDLVEECIQCSDWTQLGADHFIERFVYAGTTFDIETEGGGYSAYIEIDITAGECCFGAS